MTAPDTTTTALDSMEVSIVRMLRKAPSKGFELAFMPGAPFGAEVVLQVRKHPFPGTVAAIPTLVLEDKRGEWVKLEQGAVTLLIDLELAVEIGEALRFHELSLREPPEEEL